MSIRWMAALGAAVALAGTSGSSRTLDRTYTVNYENVLGTSLELRVRADNDAAAQHAEETVLGEITRQSRILSSWDPGSEVSRWTRTQGRPVAVSPELFEVLNDINANIAESDSEGSLTRQRRCTQPFLYTADNLMGGAETASGPNALLVEPRHVRQFARIVEGAVGGVWEPQRR